MRGLSVIILVVIGCEAAQEPTQELPANNNAYDDMAKPFNTFVDRLMSGMLKICKSNHTDLDNTTLGDTRRRPSSGGRMGGSMFGNRKPAAAPGAVQTSASNHPHAPAPPHAAGAPHTPGAPHAPAPPVEVHHHHHHGGGMGYGGMGYHQPWWQPSMPMMMASTVFSMFSRRRMMIVENNQVINNQYVIMQNGSQIPSAQPGMEHSAAPQLAIAQSAGNPPAIAAPTPPPQGPFDHIGAFFNNMNPFAQKPIPALSPALFADASSGSVSILSILAVTLIGFIVGSGVTFAVLFFRLGPSSVATKNDPECLCT